MKNQLFLYKEQGVVANYGRWAEFWGSIRNPRDYAARSFLFEQYGPIAQSRIRSPHLSEIADQVAKVYDHFGLRQLHLTGGDDSYYAEQQIEGVHSDIISLRQFGTNPAELLAFAGLLEQRGLSVEHDITTYGIF